MSHKVCLFGCAYYEWEQYFINIRGLRENNH